MLDWRKMVHLIDRLKQKIALISMTERLLVLGQLAIAIFLVREWESAPVGLAVAILGAVAIAMSEHPDKRWWQRSVWFALVGGLLCVEYKAIARDHNETNAKLNAIQAQPKVQADNVITQNQREQNTQTERLLQKIDNIVDVEVIELIPKTSEQVRKYLLTNSAIGSRFPWPPFRDEPISHFVLQSIRIDFQKEKGGVTLLSIGGQCAHSGIEGQQIGTGGRMSDLLAFPEDLVFFCRFSDGWSKAKVSSYADLKDAYVLATIMQNGKNPVRIPSVEIHISRIPGLLPIFNIKPLEARPCEKGLCFGGPLSGKVS